MSTVSSARHFMSLSELEKSQIGSIWVMNTTHAPEARLIMSILRRNGVGSDPLRVPKTFIPIDITQQIPRAQILDSADFRRSVSGGLIKIVTPEYAELILSTEEGRAEKERIDNEMVRVRTLVENEALAGTETPVSAAERRASEVASAARKGRSLDQAESNAETRAQKKRQPGTPAMKIQVICADAVSENWDAQKVKLEIKRFGEEKLTTADFKLLSSSFKENAQVFKYLREVYAIRKAELKA
jgi:hypothetical protein